MRLRHWTPRGPSARLEQALFGSLPRENPSWFAPGAALRWLVPAMACLLLTITLVQESSLAPRAGRIPQDYSYGALASSNLLVCSGRGENFWDRVTFDWTKQGQFTSTVHSLTPFWTNTLIR